MSLTNFSQGVASFGMPLVPTTTGKVFFVDVTYGLDAGNGRGTGPTNAFKTINYAVTKCTASKGDVILVMPGHTEVVTAAAGIAIGKAGVTIIGLGSGSNRPTITYTTATTASVTLTAANVTIRNIVFDMASGALDAVAVALAVTGANATIEDCKFLMADATYQGVAGISIGSGASSCTIQRCTFDALAAAGAAQAIKGVAAAAGLRVLDCSIRGDFSVAPISCASTFHQTDIDIARNYLKQINASAKVCLDLTTASTGTIRDNRLVGSTWSSAADSISSTSTGVFYFQNYGFDAAGVTSGVLVPAVGTIS